MSWGFFADLRFELPTRTWTALKKKSPKDFPLDADWSGFKARALTTAFSPPGGRDAGTSFAEILEWKIFTDECVREEKRHDGKVVTRVALNLEKSQLDVAGYLGALLEAVRSVGGTGTLALVNDGGYVGEDGHQLVVRDEKRSRRPLKNYRAVRDALSEELYPEEEDDAAGEEDDEQDEDGAPADSTLDPRAAMYESLVYYQAGNVVAARERLDAYFQGGGAVEPDLLQNYTAFLNIARPEGEALERARDCVLRLLREHPTLLDTVPLLEKAVGLLNETGRAAESIDIVFEAVARGTKLSTALAINVANSAAKARDPARIDRLNTTFREVLPKSSFRDAHFLVSYAWMLVARGDSDGAIDALGRALALEPRRRKAIAADDDFAPLREHPARASLMRTVSKRTT